MAPQGGDGRRPRPLPPGGVQRDHPQRHPRGVRAPQGHRREPGERAAGAALPRPRGRLRGLPAALGEGRPRPVGGPGAVGGGPPRGRARARDPRVRAGGVLGGLRRPDAVGRPRPVPVPGRQGRRRNLPAAEPGGGPRRRRAPRRRGLHRRGGREQAHVGPARGAVHHLDPAAGGLGPPRVRGAEDDDPRAAAVRGRPHHLHAHRLDEPVARGGGRGAGLHRLVLRPGVPAEAA